MDETGLDEGLVLLDHLDAETAGFARDISGVYLGLSIQPPSKLSAREAAEIVSEQGGDRVVLSSDISSIPSDPLALPRAALEMRRLGVPGENREAATRRNAEELYGLRGLRAST